MEDDQSTQQPDPRKCIEIAPEDLESEDMALAQISWELIEAKSLAAGKDIPFIELPIDGLLGVLNVIVEVSHQYPCPFEPQSDQSCWVLVD